MSYYRENTHILQLRNEAKKTNIYISTSNDTSVYTENKTPVISLDKLDAVVNRLDKNKLHLTSADKNRKDNKALNKSLNNNINKNKDILDIDTCFDDDIQSSMILIFISIVSIIAFIFLIFLCYKHEKLRRMISYYFTTSNVVNAQIDKTTAKEVSYIFIYLLITLCFVILLYVILKLFLKWYKQFQRYHTTLPFHGMHGHNKGPLTTIAIEFSNLSEIVNVKIAQVRIPITLL